MSSVDYYACDTCGRETLYIANLRYSCMPELRNQNPKTGHPWPDGNIGHMLILCKDCAKDFDIKIVKKDRMKASCNLPCGCTKSPGCFDCFGVWDNNRK